ncbi:MAG: ribosome silencing factor [Acidobacteriota bacterium]
MDINKRLPKPIKITISTISERKGEDIIVLDLRKLVTFTDYFIITTGNSSRQNLAIYQSIEENLAKLKRWPHHVEGLENLEWILLDYGDFIVHIFSDKSRDYYSLESLWTDAKKYEF